MSNFNKPFYSIEINFIDLKESIYTQYTLLQSILKSLTISFSSFEQKFPTFFPPYLPQKKKK